MGSLVNISFMSILLIFSLALISLSCASSCGDYPFDYCTMVGCDWVETTKTTCLGPTESDCSGVTPAACEGVKGCEWHAPSPGRCSYPDSSVCSGSETCGAGCREYSAGGRCTYPSYSDCEKLSNQSSCESAESEMCEWWAAGGYCSYEQPNCDVLDQAACLNTSGCSYYFNTGNCNPPNSDACTRYSTSDTCESSNRGCKWNDAKSNCNYPRCGNLQTESECNAHSGCEYRSQTVYCTLNCYEKTPSECDAEGSGCQWTPISYECSPPTYQDCSNLNETACSSDTSGCVYNQGRCQINYQCYPLSETECKAAGSGCTFIPEKQYCTYPDYETCSCLTQDECGAANSGCQWNSNGHCVSNSGGYCQEVEGGGACDFDNSDESCYWRQDIPYCQPNSSLSCESVEEENVADCSNESIAIGCVWKTNNSRCETNYYLECEGNSTSCTEESLSAGCKWVNENPPCQVKNYSLVCEGNDNETSTSCSTDSQAAGCKWKTIRGHCDEDKAANFTCNLNEDKSKCANGSNPKCVYVVNGSSYCTTKSGLNCGSDVCTPNACSSSSDKACSWEVNPGYCEVSKDLGCESKNDKDGCALIPYCRWESASYCSNAYREIKCYENAEKNGCDTVNSDSECMWITYPERCDVADNLECDENDEVTECSSGSSSVCKWIDTPAMCRENYDLYCVNNSENTGCNASISDVGCVWHDPTSSSCKADLLQCTAKEGSNECSAASLERGCKTRSGVVGSCKEKGNNSNGSFVVFLPFLAIVLMLTLLL